MSDAIPTLGILGAGQLAAMLTESANRIGIDTHVFRPTESRDRCSANRITTAPFDDVDALEQFAAAVDAVTVETENIPIETLRALEGLVPVHPAASVVEISQDRLLEKQFLADNNIPTARFVAVDSTDDLTTAIAHIGGPGILKTRRFGYDGKGQTHVKPGDDPAVAWRSHGERSSIFEELVNFECEISAIAARNAAGQIAIFDPGKNEHRGGILHQTQVPTRLDAAIEERARSIARQLLETHNYVGVIGVEYFVVGTELLVNETAPRVHNSGHWTQDGCIVDQFEQHVRAVMGLALGSPVRHSDVVTTNIMGFEAHDTASLLAASDSRVHLYGKREAREGRKMGHTNTVFPLSSI